MRLEEANILELKNYRETKFADTVSMSYLSIYFPIVFSCLLSIVFFIPLINGFHLFEINDCNWLFLCYYKIEKS